LSIFRKNTNKLLSMVDKILPYKFSDQLVIVFYFYYTLMSHTSQYHNKRIWYQWENIVKEYYRKIWYTIITSNYTIRWWEIDIVCSKWKNLVFVEVKTIVYVEDIDGYITDKKLTTLEKTIQTYLRKHPRPWNIQCDIVFVKHNTVYEIYPAIEF